MFQAGDLLVYGSTGVCRVLSIDRRRNGGQHPSGAALLSA